MSDYDVVIAKKVADNVICLPIFSEMKNIDIERVLDLIKFYAVTR